MILIDADLQDPPETITKMVERWRAGADVVYGKRKLRKGETFFKKITSKLYYRVFRFLSGSNAPLDTGDFRLMDRKVVDEINAMTEHLSLIHIFQSSLIEVLGHLPKLGQHGEDHVGDIKGDVG